MYKALKTLRRDTELYALSALRETPLLYPKLQRVPLNIIGNYKSIIKHT